MLFSNMTSYLTSLSLGMKGVKCLQSPAWFQAGLASQVLTP